MKLPSVVARIATVLGCLASAGLAGCVAYPAQPAYSSGYYYGPPVVVAPVGGFVYYRR